MAPVTQLGLAVLATSSVAFAARGHAARGNHAARHVHRRQDRPYLTAPYGYNNGTQTAGPTGTGAGSSSQDVTSTRTETLTSTITQTLTRPGQSGSPGDSPVEQEDAPSCGGTVYVTVTDSITVTAGSQQTTRDLPAAPGNTDSPSEEAPAPVTSATSSSVPTYNAPVYQAPSSQAAPVPVPSPESPAVPAQPETVQAPPAAATTTTAPAAPVYSAPTYEAPSSSSAAPAAPSSPSYGGGSGGVLKTKRGCLYQYGQTDGCKAMNKNGEVQWATNWASSPMGPLDDGVIYVPQLWGAKDVGHWKKDADAAIAKGAPCVLGFNEPDHPQQANIQAGPAYDLWKEHIAPLASDKVLTVSPGVTSKIDDNGVFVGIKWLEDFKAAGATWDKTAIHFYADCSLPNLGLSNDGQTSYLQKMVEKAKAFGKGIWVTEFGCYDGTPTSQIEAFMAEAVPYLEGSGVEHFAPYRADLLASSSSATNNAGAKYLNPSS